MYRKRFGLTGHPLPRDAAGTTFFNGGEGYAKLRRVFRWLADEPGLGVLTGEAGVGKTAAIRQLCSELPAPEHRVIYICDTNVRPAAVYRNLAAELGEKPKHRRDALWRQLKETITKLVERENVVPLLVLDEAQHLDDDFFGDLAGFLNYAFDTRDLLTVWLVGLPALATRLRMRHHAALATRIVSPNMLEPRARDEFIDMIEHGFTAAGATTKILAEPALEILWRVSHGVPRVASRMLRASLELAHERDQSFVDEHTMLAACDDLALTRPSAPRESPSAPPIKPRRETGTKSRR
jgi:type II secretory pathway predicted ATPase ExeA